MQREILLSLTSTFHSTKATRRLPGLDGRQNAGIVRQIGLQHVQSRHAPTYLLGVSSSESMRRKGLTSSMLYSLRAAHSKNPSFAISCAPSTFQSSSFFMVGARSCRKDCMAKFLFGVLQKSLLSQRPPLPLCVELAEIGAIHISMMTSLLLLVTPLHAAMLHSAIVTTRTPGRNVQMRLGFWGATAGSTSRCAAAGDAGSGCGQRCRRLTPIGGPRARRELH